MKQFNLLKVILLSVLLLSSSGVFSQVLGWQFALPEASTGREVEAKATTNSPNLKQSTLTRGPGAQPKQGNTRGFSGRLTVCKTLAEAQVEGAYYQFTVSPIKGQQVSLSTLTFNLRRQTNSAYIYRWMYSLDGVNFKELEKNDRELVDLRNVGVKEPNIDLKVYPDLQNIKAGKKITFRLYAWGGIPNTTKDVAFGFGKSNTKGSNVLELQGTITNIK